MNTITLKINKILQVFLLFATILTLIFSSIAHVYADPGKDNTADGAWIEAVCTIVPDGFEGSASVMVSDAETGDSFTIDCLAVNNFVGRQKLPYGKYFVDRIYTSENFYYEGFTNLYSFELSKDQAAAQRIEIEVIRNDVPEDMITAMPGTSSQVDTDSPVPAGDDTDEKPEVEGSETEEAAEGRDEDPEEGHGGDVSSSEAEEAKTTGKVIRDIGISIAVTFLFVLIVSLAVFLIRSRFYEEE